MKNKEIFMEVNSTKINSFPSGPYYSKSFSIIKACKVFLGFLPLRGKGSKAPAWPKGWDKLPAANVGGPLYAPNRQPLRLMTAEEAGRCPSVGGVLKEDYCVIDFDANWLNNEKGGTPLPNSKQDWVRALNICKAYGLKNLLVKTTYGLHVYGKKVKPLLPSWSQLTAVRTLCGLVADIRPAGFLCVKLDGKEREILGEFDVEAPIPRLFLPISKERAESIAGIEDGRKTYFFNVNNTRESFFHVVKRLGVSEQEAREMALITNNYVFDTPTNIAGISWPAVGNSAYNGGNSEDLPSAQELIASLDEAEDMLEWFSDFNRFNIGEEQEEEARSLLWKVFASRCKLVESEGKNGPGFIDLKSGIVYAPGKAQEVWQKYWLAGRKKVTLASAKARANSSDWACVAWSYRQSPRSLYIDDKGQQCYNERPPFPAVATSIPSAIEEEVRSTFIPYLISKTRNEQEQGSRNYARLVCRIMQAMDNPTSKPTELTLFIGKPGTGKNLWAYFLPLLLVGPIFAVNTQNPIQEDKFATGAETALFINYDEAQESLRKRDVWPAIKKITAENTIIMTEKFKSPKRIEFAARLSACSNVFEAMPLEPGDRRVTVMYFNNNDKPGSKAWEIGKRFREIAEMEECDLKQQYRAAFLAVFREVEREWKNKINLFYPEPNQALKDQKLLLAREVPEIRIAEEVIAHAGNSWTAGEAIRQEIEKKLGGRVAPSAQKFSRLLRPFTVKEGEKADGALFERKRFVAGTSYRLVNFHAEEWSCVVSNEESIIKAAQAAVEARIKEKTNKTEPLIDDEGQRELDKLFEPKKLY